MTSPLSRHLRMIADGLSDQHEKESVISAADLLDAKPGASCSAATEQPQRRNIAVFGHGFFGVDIGTLGDVPAVFIIPNEKAGPVGDKIPLELQGPLELEALPDDWIALTFPTRERCKEVADALVGSKMEKWTNG